ncbi:peptidase E [Pandoraea terrae]|uniref:dipeptidase E n=1 Tax=Pandoraea terrae TaxID=1537710 RepID=A0A5E4Z8X4_9BURK|nr:dipeptidase PepE [Pandoraea terrae]VVE57586.1 peptidase E [Pandoraea terrae]
MELLLLSNSRGPDGRYLVHALPAITALAQGCRNAVFIPFAGVTMTFADYTATVREALAPAGIDVVSVEDAGDTRAQCAAVAAADMVIVGGGNTFQLLKMCRERGLHEAIAGAVRGGTKYLGWSAGANLACPTICTTNDMPIVDPKGFDALNLVDWQINPHYTNALPEGHRGETRNQRIAEYLVANPERTVIGLPEGDWLHVEGQRTTLHGPFDAVCFRAGAQIEPLAPGATF